MRKKTTKDFITDACKVHGNKYDYSKVEYVNSKTKVCIICPKHGEFWMTPNSLLSGQNCPKCANLEMSKKKTQTREQVIERLKKIHGDKYIFDNIQYINMLTKVDVICPEHGIFKMTPSHLCEGHGCPECGKKSRIEKRTNNLEDFIKSAKKIHGDKYDYSKVEYLNNKTKVSITCPEHGEFLQRSLDHIQGKGCPHCGHTISKAENEIYSLLTSLLGEEKVFRHNKDILHGLEVDIYVPEFNLGIEYNGLRWHSEEFGKDRNYHVNKTNRAKENEIHLIQIFEDEWLEHKDLVLEKIKRYVHKSNTQIIGARKCIIKEIKKNDIEVFLNLYHIQGFVNSSLYLGAFYDDKLIGVMSFLEESKNKWNLTRFATDYKYSIPGLASKFFKYFLRNHTDVIEIKSFLDRRWSHCYVNVYDKLGFKLDKILPPDYRYIINSKRLHKFGFRKQHLHKKYGLPLTMTEKEMTQSLGFERIWDCGLFKYVWTNEK